MTRNRFFQTAFLSCLVLGVSFLAHSFAGSGTTYDDLKTMSFQGRLVDSVGKPITGSQSVTFKIQRDNTDIWTENQTVSFVNGVFSVTLGETNPLTIQNVGGGAGHVFSGDVDKTYEVVVTVGGETFDLPVRRVPSAMNSAFLNGQDCSYFVGAGDFTAKGDIIVGNGMNSFTKLAAGADGNVLTADSTNSDGVKWESPKGLVKYDLYRYTPQVSSGFATIPVDNSIPQISEGASLFSRTFTPTDGSNLIVVKVKATALLYHPYNWDENWTLALFDLGSSTDDAVVSDIATSSVWQHSTISLKYSFIPGSTSPITFQVRYGSAANNPASNINVNYVGYGGTQGASIEICEIQQ